MDTYTCSLCGQVKNIESRKKKNKIKLKCRTCGKKTRFLKNVNTIIAQPIKDFASSYTLAADMTIMDDHVHVEGINVRGNVNLRGTTGSNLKEMNIMSKENNPSIGNINIENSTVGSVKSNIVGGNVNVRDSQLEKLDKNIVGFTFDQDSVVLDAFNSLIKGDDFSSNLEDELLATQDIIANSTQISDRFGHKLHKVDKTQKGAIKDSIFRSLKKIGIETISKAQSKGLDKLVAWIIKVFSE